MLVCLSGTIGCPLLAAAQDYTVAFNSFAPGNTDIFLADSDGATARPWLPSPALDYNASFSADGEWIVFTSERDGSADIYRARRDGSGLERLVGDASFDDQAALSPDGQSLAFVSSRGGQADIWILDLATRAARNLTLAPSGEFRPAWAPDGSRLAFSTDRGAPRATCVGLTGSTGPGPFVTPQYTSVMVVRADGTELVRVSDANEVAGSPSWSADGTKVLFHSAAEDQVCTGGLMFATGTSRIVSVDLRTRERAVEASGEGLKLFPQALPDAVAYATATGIELTGAAASGTAPRSAEGQFGRPEWTRDGKALVFHREVARRDDPGYISLPKWSRDPKFALLALPGATSYSPDGTRMVYSAPKFTAGPPSGGELTVANADGTNVRAIFTADPTDMLTNPSWSPSGDAIVFGLGAYLRRVETGPARLMWIRSDGTGLKPLSDGTTNDGMPSWSPDGREIVFRVVTGPKRGLYVLNVESGARRPLATGADRDTFPSWSPRGDWISFTSQRDGDWEIYRIRPDGSGVRRLTSSPGHDAHSSISPDGEWVAFTTGREGFKDEALGLIVGARPPPFQSYGEIAVMRIDGSDFRILTDNSVEEGVPIWVARSGVAR